ncbi:MAG: hypothetical protein IPK24_20070 [Kineosporiaceae bacterium]|nr:hypothetical protein [Kineosporiaceae bacterium]
MSDVVVVAARRSLAVKLLSMLRDWSSLNLVNPVYVVDLDSVRPGDPQVPAFAIQGSVNGACVLQEAITRTVISSTKVCVVSAVTDPGEIATTAQCVGIVESVQASVPSAHQLRVHIFAGAPEDDWADRLAPLIGWHNLVISPEDAASPGVGAAALVRDPEDPRWLTHVVGTCCSLLGLWRGQTDAVLDHRQSLPGTQLLPVRAYSRSLAAEAVEQQVQARLVTVGVRYPVPRVDTSTALVVQDESAVAVAMADALLAKHPEVLARQRTVPPRKIKPPLDWITALKLFFGFVWDALRNAPQRLADRLSHEARRKVAAATEKLLFGGADAGFTVVVKGVKPDGSLASWGEFEAALDQVIIRTAPNAQLGVPADTSQLWRDFVDAGMTLLDAGQRSADLLPRFVGAQRAVISTTERVASKQDGDFVLPDHLAAYLPGWRIEVADSIGADRLRQRLEELKQTKPNLAHDLTTEQHRLAQWNAKAAGSYVGRVGGRLGDAFRGVVAEIELLQQRVAALRAQAAATDATVDQASLGSRLRLLTLAMAGVLTVFGVLTGMQMISAWLGALLMLLSVLVWIVSGVTSFQRHQSRLFAMIHRMEQSASDLETAERHLAEAHEDLRTITRAYRHYLDWARAFGAFVHAPLGSMPDTQIRSLHVGQGMPRSVRIGAAVANPDAVDEVSNLWRPRLFDAGWLADCWQEFLADVPSTLGDLRYQLAAEPALLEKDQNLDGQGSILHRWSRAVAERAPHRNTSNRFVAKVQHQIEVDESSRSKLLATVQVEDAVTGEPMTITHENFLAGLDHDHREASGAFLDSMFAAHAGQARMIGDQHLIQQSRGLTQATVLIQFGTAATADQFRRTAHDERLWLPDPEGPEPESPGFPPLPGV